MSAAVGGDPNQSPSCCSCGGRTVHGRYLIHKIPSVSKVANKRSLHRSFRCLRAPLGCSDGSGDGFVDGGVEADGVMAALVLGGYVVEGGGTGGGK